MSPSPKNPLAAVSSPDLNRERLATLKKLFPDLFSNEGRLNLDELKKVVDPALVTETERYDFRWYGKTRSKRNAFTPSRAALVHDSTRSVNPDKANGNLIIEGENLEVLKLLTSAYRERIKCIYIDPPYNTGNDFVYSDNFAEGQKPYWEQTGVTQNGVKVDTNTSSDGRFHSNWLSMMQSRLLVARYLLRPDGAIFVSIDDNELSNLRRIMDEVFGEENFLGCVIWQHSIQPKGYSGKFSVHHNFILCYQRSDVFELANLERTEEHNQNYSNPDNDPNGPWRTGDVRNALYRPNLIYDIDTPSGKKISPPQNGWRWSRETVAQKIASGEIVFSHDESRIIRKIYLKNVEGRTPETIWFGKTVGTTRDANEELKQLFDSVVPFDTPKPSKLIQHMLQLSTDTESDNVVLDFFGGSGTTAQAVMELNKADGGNRKFILVQLPELTDEKSAAHKAGFKKISDITIERVKRVIARIQDEASDKLPGDPQREFADSLGFKVYTLAKSHFPRVEFAPDPAKTEAENIALLEQYIREKENTFDIQFNKDTVLDEVLLKNGFMLDYTLTPCPEFTKNEVFRAKDAHKEALVCLDRQIAPETVDHFKGDKQSFFICLELALDTTKKWNLKHHLSDRLNAM
ncbi:MAG TPA: site-specific DNA-methyltransferase [Kiritimatiellia bacterium]|jgi:adenine-specific DNA-methyltransferase|nr:MAG: putative methyltransferase [Verrucomicrobia bacterium ADurb.Bin018]HOE00017.1 site-specific DNA-methyltransferase [Kiritimatiellia bacterium]HOE36317.1 site-specific DNA-methyltransferase [Kiritimatiellia bacterium]HOR73923.1 site-specific DNA-methyltransferase [Kiritimatiellia bacterium]HPK68702.1 site-specific DNA-methyltransferase [Kiritimatiellia bacterium]